MYGVSIAPRLWAQHLLKALLKLGFVQSDYYQCMLLRHDMIIVLYVDDAGLAAANVETVDKLIDDLLKAKFELTREGSGDKVSQQR